MEHVVAQDERARPAGEERPPDGERLREPARLGLLGVLQAHAQRRAVAEELPVGRHVARGGDDQHLADAGEHQHGERVVHERLVVDGQQLLADRLGDGVQPGPRPTREYDAFHEISFNAEATSLSPVQVVHCSYLRAKNLG